MLHITEQFNHPDRPIDDDTVMLLILAGTSESGKSAFGKYAVQENLGNRLKYLKAASEASFAEGGDGDPFAHLDPTAPEDIREKHAASMWRKVEDTARANHRVSVVETMKHPHTIATLGRLTAEGTVNANFALMFIDASPEQRVIREAAKTGRPIDDVRVSVAAKDAEKALMGTDVLQKQADIIVMNDGTQPEYMEYVDGLLRTYNQQYPSAHNAVVYD